MRAAAWLIPGLLAGCTGGSAGGDRWFPLGEGHHWTYRVTTVTGEGIAAPDRSRLVIRNRGRDSIDGEAAWRRRSDDGNEYWHRSDASGVYRVASRGALDEKPRPDAPRRYVLRTPLEVGTSWQAPTVPYVLARTYQRPNALRHVMPPLTMTYRIDALDQTVEVPAGAFTGCLRVQGVAEIRLYVDSAREWRLIPMTSLEWYCPDVGLVRLERQEPSPTQLVVGGTVTLELVAWR